jgi:hypothetical protein
LISASKLCFGALGFAGSEDFPQADKKQIKTVQTITCLNILIIPSTKKRSLVYLGQYAKAVSICFTNVIKCKEDKLL